MSGTARTVRRTPAWQIAARAISACAGRPRLRLGDAMLEIDPVARRNAQQVGRAPDHVILELADIAVGIYQLPHHFDDAKPAGLIDRAHDDAGEMVEID